MPHRLLLLSVLLAGVAAPLRADGGGAAADWDASRAAAVEKLETLAKRANGRRLFRSRDAVYEELLAFDPDHAKARSWLKYKRREGEWVRPRYSPPKDRGSKSARAEHQEAVVAWRSWWRQEVRRVHQRARERGDVPTADDVLRFALGLRPDDAEFRALAGEVRDGDGTDARWILADTERALVNRARFLAVARQAMPAVPAPRPGSLQELDRGDAFAWPTVLRGRTVRVVGNVSKAELEQHYRIAESAAAVFASVFGIEATLPVDSPQGAGSFPLYVVGTREQGNRFLAAEPGLAARDRATLDSFDLSFLPTRPGAVVKADSAAVRREATAHAVHAHFTREHLGHDVGRSGAWAEEAVAIYLAWLQVETRHLHGIPSQASVGASARPTGPFGRPVQGEEGVGSNPVDATTDWYAQAAASLTARTPAELRTPDLLAGYGIAVYVLEAHSEVSVAFFRDVASQQRVDLDAVLEKHLGRDATALLPHLLRWLREMSELAPPRS